MVAGLATASVVLHEKTAANAPFIATRAKIGGLGGRWLGFIKAAQGVVDLVINSVVLHDVERVLTFLPQRGHRVRVESEGARDH